MNLSAVGALRIIYTSAQTKYIWRQVASTWHSVSNDWEKAHLLNVFVALSGDPKSFFLSNHIRWLTTTCHCSFKVSDVLFWPLQAPVLTWQDNTKPIIKYKTQYFKSVIEICKIIYNLVLKLNVLRFYEIGCQMIDTWLGITAFYLQDEQSCVNCQIYFWL